MWTDETRNYLTTTIFYVHRDWKLVKRVLSTSQFDSSAAKSGEAFKNLLVGNLYGFGLDPSSICNLVYVTVPDPMITSALNTFRRLDCGSAVIDKVLDITFDTDYLTKQAPEVLKVLTTSTVIVTCMKQSGLIQDIPSSFIKKEKHKTWSVKLEMLMFVREHYDLINQTVFPQEETENLISPIHLDILIFLIEFLQPFKQAIDDLEDFHYPTINLVLPWYCKLLKHTQSAINDTCMMSAIKSKCHMTIKENFSIHILHKTATFLWPEFKCLKMISKSEQEEVHNAIRNMISQEKMDSKEDLVNDPEQPEKKPKISFSEWEDNNELNDEVSNYINLNTVMSDERDLLSWWSCKTKIYPGLSKIARSILAIPASSCSTDSTTSLSVKAFRDRRSILTSDTIDGILFLHSNLG
ncbi:zinc finger protein 618-like [Centruroides sculpturatus]|uniref:zinc finger protein 618-like n=1 Tax=Centruroides sculpturatus TaxID=218467 RepID=UPI000C6E7D2D|nr:zinc finger protein 618-like [Centruroides sculpturatus]